MKDGIKTQTMKILGYILLMQFMFLAFQGVQVNAVGVNFAPAIVQAADLSSTDLSFGSSDPVEKIGSTAKKIINGLIKIGAILLGLAFAILAIGMMKGRVDMNKGLYMIAGGVLLGSCMGVAEYIVNK